VADIRSATSNAPLAAIAFCQTPSFSQFDPVTVKEVFDHLSMIPSKSCCLDPFPTWLVKQLKDTLAPVITSLRNCSFQAGVLPAAQKQAIVLPRLKKPTLDSTKLTSYRPISNPSHFQTVAASRFVRHAERNALFPVHQSAQRQGHSTETAMLCVNNYTVCAVGEKRIVALVSLDLNAVSTQWITPLYSRCSSDGSVSCNTALTHIAPAISVRSHSKVLRRWCDITTDQRLLQQQHTTRLHVQSCRVHHLHRGCCHHLQEAQSQASPVCGRQTGVCGCACTGH